MATVRQLEKYLQCWDGDDRWKVREIEKNDYRSGFVISFTDKDSALNDANIKEALQFTGLTNFAIGCGEDGSAEVWIYKYKFRS